MPRKTHIRAADIHGASRLAVDATLGLTSLVENMHHNISRLPSPWDQHSAGTTRGITGLVYRAVRGTTRWVGMGLDRVLGPLAQRLDQHPPASSQEREAVLAALNGALGDHLEATGNPLGIPMQLRHDGRPLRLEPQPLATDLPDATGKILILVHGLCMNDLQWTRKGYNHGAELARAGGFTPLYLHYNSGRHIAANGRELANLLERLQSCWPTPVQALVIVGHSMGGLVARSACHYGQQEGHAWLHTLQHLTFLGTPHHGAPLERGGNWITLALERSPYTAALARLGKIRSAGITDLRHGKILDAAEEGSHRSTPDGAVDWVPLPTSVQCHALAATLAAAPGDIGGALLGDGLVPVSSALGQHPDPNRCLDFAPQDQWIAYGMNHMDLLSSPEVGAKLQQWLVDGSTESTQVARPRKGSRR